MVERNGTPERAAFLAFLRSLRSAFRAFLRSEFLAFLRSPQDLMAAGLEACNEYSSGKESAPEVSCSSLVVIGTEDRMSPAFKGRELASLIPDCKQEILPGCGHMMMLEDSKSSLEALKKNL